MVCYWKKKKRFMWYFVKPSHSSLLRRKKFIDVKPVLHYSFCPPCSFLLLFVFLLFFAFLFHLLFSLSLTLIIGIFYHLNYTSLLLHLITTHLVSHLSLPSIVFIISTPVIGIFYCLNYSSLLLHLIIKHLVIYFIITM